MMQRSSARKIFSNFSYLTTGRPLGDVFIFVLFVVLFLASLNLVLGVFLMSCDRQVKRMKSHSVAASFNLVANFVLIRAMGIMGAATAALLTEALLLTLFMIALQDTVGLPKIVSRLVIGSVGTASFCFVFWLFSIPPFYIVIPASVLLYTGILALFKETRKTEIRILINTLKKTLTTIKLSL